jgi:hypothetical protein
MAKSAPCKSRLVQQNITMAAVAAARLVAARTFTGVGQWRCMTAPTPPTPRSRMGKWLSNPCAPTSAVVSQSQVSTKLDHAPDRAITSSASSSGSGTALRGVDVLDTSWSVTGTRSPVTRRLNAACSASTGSAPSSSRNTPPNRNRNEKRVVMMTSTRGTAISAATRSSATAIAAQKPARRIQPAVERGRCDAWT